MKKSAAPWLLVGGGLTALAAIVFGVKKSADTTTAIEKAVAGVKPLPGTPVSSTGLPKIAVHLTGYWPLMPGLSAKERLMEGDSHDRRGRQVHTLEQHMADPVKHPYVSVAGDHTIWPDGQRISISAWPNAIFRMVDTGGHFFGPKKVYRVQGEEPLDICVDSPKTIVPKKNVTATIHVGDTFGREKGPRVVDASRFKDQTVVTGNAQIVAAEMIVGAYYDALERGL